ncbi:phospholipid phosphatase-related protein type 4 [Alosa alosa]|uniref:phospholipid phosphatase-related protein type 4 n=1 Tax=Alosa alosa TaxID=278164 RepID=UPI0020150EDC|nr:phospholipid phosphatase-related protein type 4 [Alosa alosa]
MSAKERPKGKVTKDSVTLLPCFYFVELPILVSSVVSLYFLELTDMFKPVRSGFSCNDRSLSLPYIEPTHEAVPFLMLLSLAFAAPAITIMIGEGILFCCLSRRHNGAGAEADINAAGCNFNSYIRRAVRFVGVHVFGLCATALITDIIQLATGYHAPYFLTVCKPNYTSLNTSCDENAYIMDDICSGADPAIINAGRKSFPSQHATLASFAAVYISMYFNSTLTDSSKLLKPLLVFSFIICAIICGLTRIIQYKNHAIDVYLGFILGGGIAVYLGLYAVGNFQASEEESSSQPPLRGPPRTLPAYGGHEAGPGARHLPAKGVGGSSSSDGGLSTSHSEGALHRNHHGPPLHGPGSSMGSLKRSSADVEVISPITAAALAKDSALVTFSNTLPRAHVTASVGGGGDEQVSRRTATYHASMDSSRSKQLLSQWKSKNENRKLSLQAMEPGGGGGGGSVCGPSPSRSMDGRCSSEPSSAGLNGELLHLQQQYLQQQQLQQHLQHQQQQQQQQQQQLQHYHPSQLHQGPAAQYLKLATVGNSNTLPTNPSGITGGARVSMQSRPGSSQLVHIPEETQEMGGCGSPTSSAAARAKWQKAAEMGVAVSTTSSSASMPCVAAGGGGQGGQGSIRTNGQPRIMQVIAMSKQQGLLHSNSQSSEGSGNSFRYKTLQEQQEMMSTGPASLRGRAQDTRVTVQAPCPSDGGASGPGSGSWTWKSQGSLRQSFELNDLNRDSGSSESLRDSYGSADRVKRVSGNAPIPAAVPTVPIVSAGATVTTISTGSTTDHHHPQPPYPHPHLHQGISTIRVTPLEGSGDGALSGSESLSVASSRESTLRRKGNLILIPERSNSPDNARNIFYKGTSSTPVPRE